VGRLAAVKNVGMLLDSFARVVARFPAATLRIVGDGPERAALERRAVELGVASQVGFLGFRSDTDALLADADAFVLASFSEGIPMAVLEAMRAGLPVIATRVGGIPATVTDGGTGVLVDSGDVDALARALGRAAAEPGEFDSLGLAGYRRVAEHFSMDAMVRSYERLYGAGSS
jgi:glycosyltransferase involved in cell wall biosynthesis